MDGAKDNDEISCKDLLVLIEEQRKTIKALLSRSKSKKEVSNDMLAKRKSTELERHDDEEQVVGLCRPTQTGRSF